MKFVLHGTWFRVQITVYDWTGTKWSNEPVRYTVRVLSQDRHPSTAFSKGDQVYHGESYAAAMGIVWRYFQGTIPEELRRYATVGETR